MHEHTVLFSLYFRPLVSSSTVSSLNSIFYISYILTYLTNEITFCLLFSQQYHFLFAFAIFFCEKRKFTTNFPKCPEIWVIFNFIRLPSRRLPGTEDFVHLCHLSVCHIAFAVSTTFNRLFLLISF